MLTLSSMPDFKAPDVFPKFSDKIVHFFEYGIWATLFLLMLKQENRVDRLKRAFALVLIFGVILGLFDEIHQGFISGRSMDKFDLMADVIGIMIAMVVFGFFYGKQKYYIPEKK